MTEIRIDHPHNEASALLRLHNAAFLKSRGWDLGFWIVSDELEVREAVAALGRKSSGEWEVVSLKMTDGNPATSKTCEDCETLARAGNRVYIFGSQFGAKEGPLEPKRHFIARFNEALLEIDKPSVGVDVVRRPFAIHRLVNDALRAAEIETLPLDPEEHDALVASVVREGKKRRKSWRKLVREDDVPVDVEGSAFIDGGLLLLGLRYPVTADGHPILVEIEGIDRLFEEKAAPPEVTAVRILEDVGSRRRPAGVRELDAFAGHVHVITGALDKQVRGKLGAAPSEHWKFRVPSSAAAVEAKLVHSFGRGATVEGIALEGDRAWYVHDDEQIRLETLELSEPASRAGAARDAARAGSRSRRRSGVPARRR
jgi:hypothetical protein